VTWRFAPVPLIVVNYFFLIKSFASIEVTACTAAPVMLPEIGVCVISARLLGKRLRTRFNATLSLLWSDFPKAIHLRNLAGIRTCRVEPGTASLR
jgi:hypothetical protein